MGQALGPEIVKRLLVGNHIRLDIIAPAQDVGTVGEPRTLTPGAAPDGDDVRGDAVESIGVLFRSETSPGPERQGSAEPPRL
jgi:hypothetical protein